MRTYWGFLNYFGYVLAIAAVLFAGLDGSDSFILISGLSVGLFVTVVTLKQFESDTLTYGIVFVYGIMTYFNVAFVWKLLQLMFFYDETWISILVSASEVKRFMASSFVVFLAGYIAVLLVFIYFRRLFSKQFCIAFSLNTIRISPLLFWLVSILLLGKFWLMTQYDIGVMGTTPMDLGVPFLSGFFALFMDTDIRFIISILILFVFKNSSGMHKIIIILLALADIALGTGVGASKHVAVYYLITLTFIMYYVARANGMRGVAGIVKTNKVLLSTTAIIGLLLAIAYPLINSYRYYAVYNKTGIAEAISNVRELNSESGGFLLEVANRINGIENLEVGTILMTGAGKLNFSFVDFLSGEIPLKFAISVTDSATLFGLTEFGYMYIYNGIWFVFVSSIFLGLILAAGFLLICRVCKTDEIRFLSFLGYLIMALNLLMGAGDLLLLCKDFVVYLIIVFYLDRKVLSKIRLNAAPNVRQKTLILKGGML